MKLVLDSSVLLAAIARPGVCAQLLDEVTASHTLVCSRHILDEVTRNLLQKFRVPPAVVRETVLVLEAQAEMVLPLPVPPGACRDPHDLPVLGTAIAGRVALLITVDKDLLILGEFEGIAIVKPGEFWKRTNVVSSGGRECDQGSDQGCDKGSDKGDDEVRRSGSGGRPGVVRCRLGYGQR